MDCKYVRESNCLCFTFHPLASSLFYLTNTKNRLRIIEENLYTGLVKNQFAVPLRQQSLNVDNYILTYSPEKKQVMLTLSNQILVYSLELKTLIFVGEAYQSKTPCFIQKAVYKKGFLYFSATQQYQLFSVKLEDCIKNGTINHYNKFKMPEVRATTLAVGTKKLVALCSDYHLRVWDCDSCQILKAIHIERLGEPVCLSFSKESEYLLVGTTTGIVLGYDASSLGQRNINILNKQICKDRIQSLSWFHYSGEAQSRRFLALTRDGNVKLYSFYFQRIKQSSKQKLMGRANELLHLYINKCHISQDFQIKSHQFSNFIYFHSGVLLYMVDYYPKMYYPVIASQYSHSFESLVPNDNKEVYFEGNFLLLDGLLLKRLKIEPQTVLSLDSVLEYKGLKVLKMDYRPKFTRLEELPVNIIKGVPTNKLRYKVLITYYLQNMIRCLVLSKINIAGTNQSIQNLKDYTGYSFLFLGPQSNLEPLLMILQEDKQTITVLNQYPIEDCSMYLEEERPYLKHEGYLYEKQLKIKIQKIFETPFRNNYVVLYLSQNLIRFSNNIHIHSDLLDYDVYLNLGLRMDYNDIIIDIVWTSRGQIGCVVCLEKVVLINDELKIIKSVLIQGYVIQAQFVGYTLVITTKVDVQYVDVAGQPLQLYCIENYESKYLILGIMCDRIIGIQRFNGVTNCKMRYFNLMQPLISGYINYYNHMKAPINSLTLKKIIQGFSPYHIVSEEFLALLNKSSLSNYSRYFIQSHIKLYSRSIRASTLNSQIKIQRFIANKVWLQHKNKILDYLLFYEDMKDSTDNYQVQKSKEYLNLLTKMIGTEALSSIKQIMKEEKDKGISRPSIVQGFGKQSLFEVFYEFIENQNIFVKMELIPFKATDDREWIGITGLYLQSKIGQNEQQIDVNAVIEGQNKPQNPDQPQPEQESQFGALILYYRFDEGKGDFVEDLSDCRNEGIVEGQPWKPLEDNDPLQFQDKWGKKCPPQFSISNGTVKRQMKIGSKGGLIFSFQIWIKTQQTSFNLLKLGQNFQFGMKNGSFYYKTGQQVLLQGGNNDFEYIPGSWTNVTFIYNHKQKKSNLYLNSFLWHTGKADINFNRSGLEIGNPEFNGEFTQFRLWRKVLEVEDIKQYLRSPLGIVAEKRNKLRAKVRDRKKKKEGKGQGGFFPALQLDM